MKVKIAKTAGFCMGVRRALELVLAKSLKESGPIYTYGPLIHNRQVVELLEKKGIKSIGSIDELDEVKEGVVVIRAHGIPPDEKEKILKKGLRILDATCPKVAKVQGIIRYYTGKGYAAIIVGDPGHAEVKGLVGHSQGPVFVIQCKDDVKKLPDLDKVILVAQTTQNRVKYGEIAEEVKKRFPSVKVFNTICDATTQRQEEVRKLARETDCVVVVGGYHSGNTKRLVQVAKEEGAKVFHVETEKELNKEELSKMNIIGVTAGASTPNWIIKKVVSEIENIKKTSFLKELFRFLIMSNIAVSLGASSLSYAYLVLSGLKEDILYPVLSFLYVYAMHVLNLFLDKGASAYNDPQRAEFLKKRRRLLLITSISSVIVGVFLAYLVGIGAFLFITGLCILGLLYSMPIFPEFIQKKYGYKRIKDIPGSRSLSEAVGWFSVISVFPILGNENFSLRIGLASAVVFMLGYARSLMFDILQIQGDLIVGTETLPITIGEKKTLFIIKSLLLSTFFTLLLCGIFKIFPSFSYLMFITIFVFWICLILYEKKIISVGYGLEILMEINFMLTGLFAVIWKNLT